MAASQSFVQFLDRHRSACVWALFAGITILRFSVDNPGENVDFLYVGPIAIAAVHWGIAGGLWLSTVAACLTIAPRFELVTLGDTSRVIGFLFIGVVTGSVAGALRRREAERDELLAELRDPGRTDRLTGLPNLREWDRRLEIELERAELRRLPLTVAVLKLNGVRAVNEAKGREAGDRMLRAAAAAWRQWARETDLVARLGGDEFGIVFPALGPEDSPVVGARLSAMTPAAYACSIGFSCWNRSETAAQLVQRARAESREAQDGLPESRSVTSGSV